MKQKLPLIAFFIFCGFILSPCTLEQYVHRPVIQILAKFPSNKTNRLFKSPIMARPDGTDETYVPAFVDRIHLEISGTDLNGDEIFIEKTNVRKDGVLSNEFGFEEFPYGSNYNVKVDVTMCDDNPIDCEVPHITHEAEVSAQMTGNSAETLLLLLNLETKRGAIDDVPSFISVNGSIIEPPDIPAVFEYLFEISNDGHFALCWSEIKANPEHNRFINIFDSNKSPLLGSSLRSDGDNFCKFLGNNLLYTFVDNNDGNKLKVIEIQSPYEKENDPVTIYEPMPVSMASAIAVGFQRIVIGWNISSTPSFLPMDAEYNLLRSQPSATKLGIGDKPYIKIIDKDRFLVSAIQDDFIKIKILNMLESADISPPITLTSEGDIQDSTFFNYSMELTGDNTAVFIYESTLENDKHILKGIFYDTENGEVSGSFNPVFYSDVSQTGYAQYHPWITNAQDDNLVLVWADNRDPEATSAPFQIRYHLSAEADSDYLGWEDASNKLGSPKVAINSDGFGAISWFSKDSRIYFRRFMF